VRCGDGGGGILRRPFSLHRVYRQEETVKLEFLIREVGVGTRWLRERRAGEYLDLIGPLGNGFLIEQAETAVLIARGIGIAPLYAVGEALREKRPEQPLHVIMGARFKERLFYRDRLAELGTLHIYTDDGSEGFSGRAPELLAYLVEKGVIGEGSAFYACGPGHMLRELARLAGKASLRGQVALESHMGCGFGVCLSCAVPLTPETLRREPAWPKPALQSDQDGRAYSLVCKDGPIYDAREVDWDEWLA
jgi:dihydroorotate dehydrogenase electron transfer subunit